MTLDKQIHNTCIISIYDERYCYYYQEIVYLWKEQENQNKVEILNAMWYLKPINPIYLCIAKI